MSLPFKSNQITVISGGAGDPTISAGTADPTLGLASPEGSLYLRYAASSGQVFFKTGPGNTDWFAAGVGGGSALDPCYDFGGPGAGRIITADAGAVQIDATTADTQAALIINRSPASAAAAVGINMTIGANVNTLGNGIQITDAGTGNSISVQKNAAGVVLAANLTDPGAQALTVTVNAAPTSVSPVSIVANQSGTTASLLSISKIPGVATAGAAIAVSMGASTTGPGITVSQAGTGAAIQVASGAVEMANSSPAVSAANQGRIKYDSTTQTFQVSLNGATYSSLMTNRVLSGSTSGLGVGESVELTTPATIQLEDDKGYIITVYGVAKGLVSASPNVQTFRQTFAVRRTAGLTTIATFGTLEQLGDAASASWTLLASVGTVPDRFALTFTTGTTTSAAKCVASVVFTEVLNP